MGIYFVLGTVLDAGETSKTRKDCVCGANVG